MNPGNEEPQSEEVLSQLERRMAAQPMRSAPRPWRSEILEASAATGTSNRFSAVREFLCPSPWVWGALAGVWVLVASLFTAAERTADSDSSVAWNDSLPGRSPLIRWQAQQALISALLDEAPPLERQPAAAPRPRSGLHGPRFGRVSPARSVPTLS